MYHSPATTVLLLIGAVVSSAQTGNNNKPIPKSGLHESWASSAQETVVAGHENDQQLALGWSPKPTQAPKPLLGRMMIPRADDFTLGPQTCGFVPGTAGNSFTCISVGYTCTPQQGFVGCCEPNSACSLIKTTCIDYQASQGGACNLPSDYHTLCCGTSSLPACYTWVVSTSTASDASASLYTLFDCSAQAGTGTLLTVDPGWSSTHIFGSTATTTTATTTAESSSSSSSTSTTFTSTTSTPEPTHKSSSTPVGAIAGGTVGGVAALGLVGLAAFLFVRRRNPRNAPPTAALGGPPQGQNPAAGAVYPSGVPVGYQAGYAPVPMQSPQQGYDPHMSQYGHQGVYPQQQQQYPGQYPPQQQYNYPVQLANTSPVYTTPSPGAFKEGDMSPQQQQPPTELAAVNAVGAEDNRAELGN